MRFSNQVHRLFFLYRLRLAFVVLAISYLSTFYESYFLLTFGAIVFLSRRARYLTLWMIPGVLAGYIEGQSWKVPEGVYSVSARVASEPRYSRPGGIDLHFVFRLDGAPLKKQLRCRGVHLPWRNSSQVRKGDVVSVLIEAQSGRRLCRLHAISLPRHPRKSLTRTYREGLINRVRKILGDGERSGVVLALTLGVRDGLLWQTDNAIRSLGLSHVFVISGFHFGFVFLLVHLLVCGALRWCPQLFVSHSHLRTWIPIVVMGGYLSLLSEGQAALRAFLIIVALRVPHHFGLRLKFHDALFLSAIIIFWASPRDSLSVSSLLSLAALGVIALLLLAKCRSKLLFAFAIWVGVSLPGVLIFERVCWSGAITSLLIGPIVAILGTGGGLIGIVLMEIGLDRSGAVISSIAMVLENILHWFRLIVTHSPVPLCTRLEGTARLLGVGCILGALIVGFVAVIKREIYLHGVTSLWRSKKQNTGIEARSAIH